MPQAPARSAARSAARHPRTAWRHGFLASALAALALVGIAAAGLTDRPAAPELQTPTSTRIEAPAFDPTHLLPKTQTGADRFLQHFPEADGRGIVVAIFDTGVDPGAPGLQVTTDGKPKIIDVIDASGSGDVDTTTKAAINDDGTITGLTGRTLRPDTSWTNPTGEFRLGVKAAFDLFPGEPMPRIRAERARAFDEAQREALAQARADLAAFDRDHPAPTRAQLEDRAELAARVELLTERLASDLPDPGPVYDCLVWHDGERWMAAIDTHEDGDFTNETPLTNFRDSLRFATFPGETLVNFAVNIYDEGDTLSIVVDCGDHGTHVAGIVAANYPDRPELNGIAPGAQIVAVKIGDTRLRSSSTNVSEIRGLAAVLQNNVRVINKSYGGASPFPDHGRIVEIQREIIHDHRVVYVSSAGNSGPALSTVGSPGGTSSAMIGVGATVDPDMARAQYGLRRSGGTTQFTWSSRGPTIDGDLGVDVTAPGGAFAPVPNWALAGVTQMNGTSMSSPSVAGAVALLLSAADQHGIDPAPESVKRSLMATARPVPGLTPLDVGAGMIDIPAAWEHLAAHAGLDDDAARYELRVNNSRGVYLRQPHETDRPSELRVNVTPRFPTEHDRNAMVAFDRRVTLRADADWAVPAESVLLTTAGGSFALRVEPQTLEPGLHVATVFGFDAERPERGPIFRLPVTVVRPMPITREHNWRHRERLDLDEGEIVRRFYAVPEGATWADLTLRRLDQDTGQTLVLHAVQLIEGESHLHRNTRAWIGFEDGDETLRSFALEGGRTLEVAIARNWSGLGQTSFEYEIAFRGLRPVGPGITLLGGSGVVGLDVAAPFRRERLQPRGQLTHLRRSIAPSNFHERPIKDPRDRLPNGRIPHELVIEYPFEIEEDGTYQINPAATLQPYAWPSHEGFIWMILDEDNRQVHFGAYYASDVELKKGKHTLRLQFRHDDAGSLTSLRALPLFLDRRLPSPIRLAASATPEAALAGNAMNARVLHAGDTARVWIRVPAHDALPKDAKPGDVLIGTMTLGGPGGDIVGAQTRPGGWPIVLTVAPKPAEPSDPKPSDAEPKDERSALDKLAEAVRDLKVERLGQIARDDQESYDALEREILREWPDHLPVLAARLRRLSADKDADPQAVLTAAEAVVRAIDRGDLAAHFGTAIDDNDPEARRHRREMTKTRDTLIDALRKQTETRLRIARDAEEDARAEKIEAFETAKRELAKWADLNSADYIELRIGEARLHNRPAVALRLVRTELDKRPANRAQLRKDRAELLRELGWNHWAERAERHRVLQEPKTKPRF